MKPSGISRLAQHLAYPILRLKPTATQRRNTQQVSMDVVPSPDPRLHMLRCKSSLPRPLLQAEARKES